MRKTFPFTDLRHKPERVVEQIKSTVRKYLKRERRKELPEGVDFWDFDCRTGQDESTAAESHVSALIAAIDAAVQAGWETIYLEILAKPGRRTPRLKPADGSPLPTPSTDEPEAPESD